MNAAKRLRKKFWERHRCALLNVPSPTTGTPTTVDVQREALVNEYDITGDIVRLSGILPYYRQLRDNAESALNDTRHEEHNVEEELYRAYRLKAGKEEKKKAPTETEVKMSIRNHSSMKGAFRRRMDAEKLYRELKSAVDALEDKKFFLQALAKSVVSTRFSEKDSI